MSTCGCNLISFDMCQQTAEKLLSIISKKLELEVNNGIQNKSHTALVLVI